MRNRGADVDLLAKHFVNILNERFGFSRRIHPAALEILRRHSWPGNIRELLHAIEAAMVVCEGTEILAEHFPAALRTPAAGIKPPEVEEPLLTLEEMERLHIKKALRASGGHRGKAAGLLGISERNLYRKLREYEFLD